MQLKLKEVFIVTLSLAILHSIGIIPTVISTFPRGLGAHFSPHRRRRRRRRRSSGSGYLPWLRRGWLECLRNLF